MAEHLLSRLKFSLHKNILTSNSLVACPLSYASPQASGGALHSLSGEAADIRFLSSDPSWVAFHTLTLSRTGRHENWVTLPLYMARLFSWIRSKWHLPSCSPTCGQSTTHKRKQDPHCGTVQQLCWAPCCLLSTVMFIQMSVWPLLYFYSKMRQENRYKAPCERRVTVIVTLTLKYRKLGTTLTPTRVDEKDSEQEYKL